MKAPSAKSQAPTLSDRAKNALMVPPNTAPSGEIYGVALLRQWSTEAFVLSRLAAEKGEQTFSQCFNSFARAMGKSARLIEDLAKEHLRRSRRPIENRKSKIKNGRNGK